MPIYTTLYQWKYPEEGEEEKSAENTDPFCVFGTHMIEFINCWHDDEKLLVLI